MGEQTNAERKIGFTCYISEGKLIMKRTGRCMMDVGLARAPPWLARGGPEYSSTNGEDHVVFSLLACCWVFVSDFAGFASRIGHTACIYLHSHFYFQNIYHI